MFITCRFKQKSLSLVNEAGCISEGLGADLNAGVL